LEVSDGAGHMLEALVADANESVLIVAPFIKVKALRRSISRLSEGVPLEVFTRWRPDEICVGVSDLEVWDEIVARPGSCLHLCNRLHAKLYRTESRCLVGSANVTGAALGWTSPPNLELLLEVPATDPRLIAFERKLRESSVVVDAEMYARMAELVRRYEAVAPLVIDAEEPEPCGDADEDTGSASHLETWLPSLRQPDDLFVAYSGDSASLTSSSRLAALSDIRALSLPVGLNLKAFSQAVAIAMLQMPGVKLVDDFLDSPQRFGAVVNLLRDRYDLNREDAVRAWQALMRWLLLFEPDRYERRVDRHTEMFMRRR